MVKAIFTYMSQPIVFVPGLLSDAALFAAQIAAVQAAGFTATAIPSLGGETIATIAAAVLKKAPPQFILGGLSMGGYVCLEIMRQAPERVTKLMLLNTSARSDMPEQLEKRAALIELAQIGRFKGVTPRLLPLLINKKHLQNEEMTKVIFEMAERVGRDNFVHQQRAIMSRIDSRPSLANITVPTLVIGGVDDQIAPADLSHEMAELIPNSELYVLQDCGHLSTLEQADAVNQHILRFLDK